MQHDLTGCNSGKCYTFEQSWGLRFRDTGDGGRWAASQQDRRPRDAPVGAGCEPEGTVDGPTPVATISDIHFKMPCSLAPRELVRFP